MSRSRTNELSGSMLGGRRALVISIALYALVFAVRLASPDPELGLAFLFVAPTALVALVFGLRGAVIGTVVSIVLTILWALVRDVGIGPAPYIVRGTVIAFVGFACAAFREARARLEEETATWFEQDIDLHCIASPDGRFVRVNESFVRTLGYTKADLLARPFVDFVHAEDRERTIAETVKLAERQGDSVGFENRYRGSDGSYHWLRWSATTVSDGRIYASARDVTHEKVMQHQLEDLARTDPLTGLANRRSFEEEAERLIDHVARYGSGAALLMLDLDGFKAVNDTLGHQAGDEVLFCVAERLRSRLRTSDIVARLGGDEFVILLPEATPSDASRIAGELLEQLTACGRRWSEAELPISASMGVASFEGGSAERLADLVRRADALMYEAKRAGGGRCYLDRPVPVRGPLADRQAVGGTGPQAPRTA